MTKTIQQTWTLFLTRHFAAPQAAVFKCFSSLDDMKQWFGPSTCRILDGQMDFRKGGAYKYEIETDQGTVFLEGKFTEIKEPEKISMTWQWTGNENFDSIESHVEFEFVDKEGETTLNMNHTGLETEDSRSCHHVGWSGSFDKLFLRFTLHQVGRFGWNEIISTDPEVTKKFYTTVLGWTTKDMSMGEDLNYTFFEHQGQGVAGLAPAPPETPNRWTGYINVPDIEATLKKAQELGAEVTLPPMPVGEMGTMAMLKDPTGADLSLWQTGKGC